MHGIRVAAAFGIPIRLNWTFLIVLPLFAALIAWDLGQLVTVLNDVFGTTMDPSPLTEGYMPWLLGLVAALGLFLGVLLHELGHSLVAMRYGYEIESITLWLLGGLATFAEFPKNWRHELWIALAGPVVSILVGVTAYTAFVVLPSGFDAALFILGYLAVLNIVLAAFNLLPAFPMDGGRILRALLARNHPHARATQQAAEVGKQFAFVIGLVGLFTNWFLILVALFIYIAASNEAQQTTLKAAFEDVTVAEVMTTKEDLKTVTEDTTLTDLLARMFSERHIGYPVVRNGDLVGMVTLEDSGAIRPIEHNAYHVKDVMSTDIATITPDAGAIEALQRMQQHDIGRLPVVDAEGTLVGILSRTDLMRAFDVIQTSGVRYPLQQSDPEFGVR